MLVGVVRGKARAELKSCAASLWLRCSEEVAEAVKDALVGTRLVVAAEQMEVRVEMEDVLAWHGCA